MGGISVWIIVWEEGLVKHQVTAFAAMLKMVFVRSKSNALPVLT